MASVTVALGCSGDAPEASVVPSPTPGIAMATTGKTPSLTPTAKSTQTRGGPTPERVAEETKSSPASTDSQTLDIEEFFAPPKAAPIAVKEPERPPQPEPSPQLPKQLEGPLPNMRLIGFSQLQELKALVSIDGKLNVLALGQSAEGVELVGLEPPTVTLKFGETETKIKLNDQTWVHVSSPVGENNGISPNMQLPTKPAPVTLPGVRRFPSAPTAVRTPRNPASPSSSNETKGPIEHRFPAASPPPAPPK